LNTQDGHSANKELVVNNDPKYHVLLIGIDAYPVSELYACVNDIDAVERLLREQADIPVEAFTRLASPHPNHKRETKVAEQPATLANIRAALASLASDWVQPNDRVFIYYSGHGTRAPVTGPQGTFHCESLVPVDFKKPAGDRQLLLDFEFNRMLAAIAKRTASVAVVLDCCNSTGATRDVEDPSARARSMDFSDSPPVQIDPELARALGAEPGLGSVDDCLVVAACLNHEKAMERLGDDGLRHGLLSRAFLSLLGKVDKSEIRSVPWARIWQKMRDNVETANPAQHLWISGSNARAVLAGPPEQGDAGFGIKKTGPNEYAIDAGTLADVGAGARLAVYGDKPAFFPAVGTPEDEAARVSKSLLKVVRADRASAAAQCESAPFELPAGARARLVELGAEGKVGCAVVPADDRVAAALRESDLLNVVGPREAQARLEKGNDGNWSLTDDVSGAKPAYPALVTLRPDQLDRARDILELYFRYSLPLRMATRCTDLPGQLKVKLLACPEDGVSEEDAQKADLPELIRHKALDYAIEIGTGFCVHVHNASLQQLRVVLVNCAASGKVEFLGDQTIDPRSYYRFWLRNTQGAPFVASPAGSKRSYIDRMVVIGTTLLDRDLSYLRSDTRFSDILAPPRDVGDATKDLGGSDSSRPVEKWTAAQVLLGVGIPEGA
jgi:hypothetical protein